MFYVCKNVPFIVYFNKVNEYLLEQTEFNFCVNDFKINDFVCQEGEYLEYIVDFDREYTIKLNLYKLDKNIFEFCTKI